MGTPVCGVGMMGFVGGPDVTPANPSLLPLFPLPLFAVGRFPAHVGVTDAAKGKGKKGGREGVVGKAVCPEITVFFYSFFYIFF